MTAKVKYFNGIKFVRRDDGYFIGCDDNSRLLMHRYVWEFYNGVIPKGYVIHHKDGDRGNNDIDNLECLSNQSHSTYHGTHKSELQIIRDRENLSRAREKASAWHKSDAGREWARMNARSLVERGLINPKTSYVCANCGKEFIAVKRRAKYKFCSGACEQYFRRHNGLNLTTRICEVCGKKFTTDKYGKTVTCSRSCGMKLAHLRRQGNYDSLRTEVKNVKTERS